MLWIFDVNETMLDLSPLDSVFAQHFGTPNARGEWFNLLVRSALVATASGQYRDFAQLGAACARTVAQRFDVQLPQAAVEQIGTTMRRLPAHADVPDALATLRAAGHRLVVLANSPQAVVDAQLEYAGLTGLLDQVYSAEHAATLKPGPAAYRFALEREGHRPDDSVLVAAHDWDIAGAQAAGMHTVFVARPGHTLLPTWPDPDAVVADFHPLDTLGLDQART